MDTPGSTVGDSAARITDSRPTTMFQCAPMPTRLPKRRALLIAVPALLALILAVVLWNMRRHPPRELVLGGNTPPAPRVPPETEQLDPASLESAADYAGAHGSLALIVSRHDHIVFEGSWG